MTDDYPRMMYKPGVLVDHDSAGLTLKLCNEFDNATMIVHNEDEHLAATEEGWREEPHHASEAPEKRGPGRPRLSTGVAA